MIKIKKTISLFLVALFVSYYASISLFSHLHIINGVTVIHSHIHTNSHHDTENGGHTERSITLIAQISHFEYIDFSCNYLLKPSQIPLYEYQSVETTHWVAAIHFQNLSLRAPPIV